MIKDKHTFSIDIREADFDKACNSAYQYAVSYYDIDDSGHCHKYEDVERFSSSITIKFKGYQREGSMIGHTHAYKFECWINTFN